MCAISSHLNTPTATAKAMIKGFSDSDLLTQWELTGYMDVSVNLATVRGWLMDEIQERFPVGFDKWLSLDDPRDDDLKYYVRAEMRRRRNEHK